MSAFIFIGLAACVCFNDCLLPPAHAALPVYPLTVETNQVDDYHDTKVADPYRWLEDDNSPATKAWVEAQNKVTFTYLGQIPERAAIKQRLTKLWNYERYGIPFKQGGRFFFSKNDGLQNQSVLYSVTSLDAEPNVLLDPNKLSADGTVALSGYTVSDDGNLLAYGLASAGSDWQAWKVRDVRTGQDLADDIKWVKFSSAPWMKDGKGFFLQPLRRADRGGENDQGKLFSQTLLPSPRLAAKGRPAGLRTARSQGLEPQWARH